MVLACIDHQQAHHRKAKFRIKKIVILVECEKAIPAKVVLIMHP
jgi:hypothetical protein